MRFKGSIEQAQRADVTDATYVPQERRKIALEQSLPSSLQHELRTLREAFEHVFALKKEASMREGVAPTDLVQQFIQARDAYFLKIGSYRDQYPSFFSKISRSNITVEVPPPPTGKKAVGHTIPIATSSLKSFFPGNYEHYQRFLDEHNALFRPPESVSSLGAMFVEPPRLKRDLKYRLSDYMGRQHAFWREAPWVTRQGTRADVIRLLSHYDEDFTAFVVEPRARGKFTFIGEVDKQKMLSAANTAKVHSFMNTDVQLEDIRDIEPLAAAHKLIERPYITHIDDDGRPKIITRSIAGWLNRHEPFRNTPLQKDQPAENRGLGYVSYIGVNDAKQALKEIEALYKKGQRRFMIETAHMHRLDTVYHILAEARQRWPDIVILTGTVSTPEAVAELSTFADVIKIGIAMGAICDTNEVAIQPAELAMQIECGAAAQGVVSLMVDNLGNRKTFAIKVSTQECVAVQSGGGSVTRRDSANPIGLEADGSPSKRVDGEAGLGAVLEAKQNVEAKSVDQHIDEWLGFHVEGRTDIWKRMRTPDTLVHFYHELLYTPKSSESYTGHDSLASFQGMKPGEAAELQIVKGQERKKNDDELYAPIRGEEVDIFEDVSTYKKNYGQMGK